MQVETYEVEEISNPLGIMASDSEAAELIAKLGLDGQRSLLDAPTCTRFPYRKMTKTEHLVFSILFPERTKIQDYSDGIIPIRVLQVAAFVREFEGSPCPHLMVWHTASAKEDPLLIGHTGEYGGNFYLLARWGDAILSLDELLPKAKAAWVAKMKCKIRKEITDWQQDEANLTQIADAFFATGKASGAQNSYQLENP